MSDEQSKCPHCGWGPNEGAYIPPGFDWETWTDPQFMLAASKVLRQHMSEHSGLADDIAYCATLDSGDEGSDRIVRIELVDDDDNVIGVWDRNDDDDE